MPSYSIRRDTIDSDTSDFPFFSIIPRQEDKLHEIFTSLVVIGILIDSGSGKLLFPISLKVVVTCSYCTIKEALSKGVENVKHEIHQILLRILPLRFNARLPTIVIGLSL